MLLKVFMGVLLSMGTKKPAGMAGHEGEPGGSVRGGQGDQYSMSDITIPMITLL
jgi:hypothetical protein